MGRPPTREEREDAAEKSAAMARENCWKIISSLPAEDQQWVVDQLQTIVDEANDEEGDDNG